MSSKRYATKWSGTAIGALAAFSRGLASARAIRTRSRSLRGPSWPPSPPRKLSISLRWPSVEEREGLFPQVGYRVPVQIAQPPPYQHQIHLRLEGRWPIILCLGLRRRCGRGRSGRRLHFGGLCARLVLFLWNVICQQPGVRLELVVVRIRHFVQFVGVKTGVGRTVVSADVGRWSGFRLSEMVMLRIGHIHDSPPMSTLRYSTAVSLLRIGNPSDIPTARRVTRTMAPVAGSMNSAPWWPPSPADRASTTRCSTR